jgi:hypothetical protein
MGFINVNVVNNNFLLTTFTTSYTDGGWLRLISVLMYSLKLYNKPYLGNLVVIIF